jgi:colanic acid biosynthesis glycosyl transferase WcaI
VTCPDAKPEPVRLTIIGINYSPEPTGIAPYAAGAAEGIAADGHDVVVITGYPHYPQWRIADGYAGPSVKEVINGIRVLRLWHPVPPAARLIGRSLMEVTFGLRAALSSWFGADVVLTPTPALLSGALVVARGRLTGRPVVVWVQDIYTLSATQTGNASKAAALIRRVESWTLRNASRVIVIHDRFATFLTTELGVEADKVDVVRNWSHLEESRSARSAEARARFGWGESETIVLHAGNMGAKQNLENVVRASALAAENGSRVRFVLLGDGHRRAALQALGGNTNLEFLDPLPDAEFAAALANADILLVNELPGMTEMSVPSKLTSYFSTGRPLLAAVDAGSVTAAEIAAAGAGLRIDPDDPGALLAGAQRLAADPQLCQQLGESGLAYRRAELSAPRAISGLLRSLQQAISTPR